MRELGTDPFLSVSMDPIFILIYESDQFKENVQLWLIVCLADCLVGLSAHSGRTGCNYQRAGTDPFLSVTTDPIYKSDQLRCFFLHATDSP